MELSTSPFDIQSVTFSIFEKLLSIKSKQVYKYYMSHINNVADLHFTNSFGISVDLGVRFPTP